MAVEAQPISADSPIHNPADPFYTPPTDIPTNPGTLIHHQQAPHLLNLADPTARQLGLPEPHLPGQAHRMMYTSTDSTGKPVAVTGVVIEPANPWNGPGPTPTLVMAAGTRGQGDACAPSKGPWLLGALDTDNGAVGLNYELPVMYAASLRGMRVIMTDYQGLGTPEMHHYVNRTEQARAVLDSARAGLTLTDAPTDSPIALYGYSQGGGATAAAAENATDYAPELNIVGTYSGAPPADLHAILGGTNHSMISGTTGYAINSGADRDEDMGAAIDRHSNEKVAAELRRLSNSCVVDMAARWAFRDSAELLADGRPLAEVIAEEPAIHRYLDQQALGAKPVTAPILVLSGVYDDVITFDQAHAMAASYCRAGSTVDFRSDGLPELPRKTGMNHSTPVYTHAGAALDWLTARFAGVPVAGNCETVLSGAPTPTLPVG